jgi:hypothetical protein
MSRLSPVALLVTAAALALPAGVGAHAERTSYFPDHRLGSVPEYRTSGGEEHVVCKSDSAERIAAMPEGAARTRSEDLLEACEYEHVQEAVDAASSGDRILILPGVYREEPSREQPNPDARCEGMNEVLKGGWKALTYEGQRACPHQDNLIIVAGDTDGDRICDERCNLQIEGTGRRGDVLLEGDRSRLNVIRGDRADGLVLRNFTVERSDFNNIYVLETNGFRFSDIETRYSREYGILTFTSDNGVYEDIEAHHNGDAGVYPGSGPEGGCKRYGILVQRVNSYENLVGLSGTAGNGLHVRDSKFHHNTVGISLDSLFPGHPGMPQDCTKIENNEIYSNNLFLYDDEHDEMCAKPYVELPLDYVCPSIGAPPGTGVIIQGGNGNIVRENRIYDNWREGARLGWTPAILRGVKDFRRQQDTSHDNRFVSNILGIAPDGGVQPNRLDFWWDVQGRGNCWEGNTGPEGRGVVSSPPQLHPCPGTRQTRLGDIGKMLAVITCATWSPKYRNPPGCSWMARPPQRPAS